MLVTGQYTLQSARPPKLRAESAPALDEEPEARAALVPVFDRHGMAHPRVVRATRRIGTARWFRALHA
jgi:hypothetical protein